MPPRTLWGLPALLLYLIPVSVPAADRVLLPRPEQTPGAVAASCSLADLRTSGYSHRVRPPPGFTRSLKRSQLSSGYQGGGLRSACVEEDHLIPIGWCGDPHSARNLWPQLRGSCGAPADSSAEAKDVCEYQGFELLRRGRLELASAQAGIAHDWIDYCRRVVAPLAAQHHIGPAPGAEASE